MATGSLATARRSHTATLLPNGKVLVAGGEDNSFNLLTNAELYDPASGTWTTTGSLITAREFHTATLLANGKVLVVAGVTDSLGTTSAAAEVYDPASGVWTATGSLGTGRDQHTATLLPNGKVLVAGGYNNDTVTSLASAELYDATSGVWTATGSLITDRLSHTATLLPNGEVLVAGGQKTGVFDKLASAELYDPASGTWTVTGSLVTGRVAHSATLLPSGKVLAFAGLTARSVLKSSELYDVGLGFSSAWQPGISVAKAGKSLQLTGSLFQGVSQASGGDTQDSSSNYPIVQLRSIENSQVTFLPVDPASGWSDTSFRSSPVRNFPPGPALVTVFTNGIPSTAKYLVVPSSH